MRSRAPPVADAARRSTRSGRKNRASEQREDFFGHRKAVGADAPAATFGAHLCAVRICFSRLLREKQYSYPAQLSVKGVCKGEARSPLTLFCFLLQEQKEGPRGEWCLLCLAKGPAPPAGEMRICPGKRIEKSSCHSGTGALFAGVNGEHQTALSTLPERKQRVQA